MLTPTDVHSVLGPATLANRHGTLRAVEIGYSAITAAELVHSTTARDLFAKLRAADTTAHFERLTASRAKLLIIDEIGYESLSRCGGALLSTHL